MSNLPPGVTGNEVEIAGAREFDDTRECTAEGVSLMTITPYGKKQIEDAIMTLVKWRSGDETAKIAPAEFILRNALADIEDVDIEVQCPFMGDVTLQYANGVTTWQCPVCRTEHEEEMD